jgi:hypothetical protein
MRDRRHVETYLKEVTDRLEREGFRVSRDVRYKGYDLTCVATRMRFQAEFFGFYVRCVFAFAEFSRIDLKSLKDFSKKCFCYAATVRGIPLPRGLFCEALSFAVAIPEVMDDEVATALRDLHPRGHWCAGEMPVIFDISQRQLHYSQVTPAWGRLYYPLLRSMICDMLAP